MIDRLIIDRQIIDRRITDRRITDRRIIDRRSFLKAGMAGLASTLISTAALRLNAFAADPALDPGFHLVDVTAQAGIHFRHNSGAYGGKLLPETLGAGCAFIDYDRDG